MWYIEGAAEEYVSHEADDTVSSCVDQSVLYGAEVLHKVNSRSNILAGLRSVHCEL